MTSGTVGNYKLIEKLGEGGMGAVYKAVDVMVEREVAIKMLRPEIARQPEIVERFRAEAVALAKLNHPNIATLYSFFRQSDEYYMVMEFVTGRTLEALIRGTPAMTIEQVIAISSQVLDAIEHAHTLGILHRDIKPPNIMLTAGGQVKVTDFGIARVLGKARMTQEGYVCGTLEYLAPERIRGQEADLRSDLYSMGVVLYEMLTRHLPFERGSAFELMRAHLEEDPPPFVTFGASIPPRLETTVRKALAKLPEERFGSVPEFRAALTSANVTRGIEPLRLSTEPAKLTLHSPLDVLEANINQAEALTSPMPAPSRHWKLFAVAAVVLVVAGLLLAWSWSSNQRDAQVAKPTSAPVETQPSPATMQQPVATEPDVSPASLPTSDSEVQNTKATVPAPGIKKPNAKSAREQERRKAAMNALEKSDSAQPNPTKKKEAKDDRRSSALKALNE